jgi:hypothetical protein
VLKVALGMPMNDSDFLDRVEKNYQEWLRLPFREREKQNELLNFNTISQRQLQQIAIVECA